MALVLALTVGGLVTAGVYLVLRRSVVKILLGLVLLGHAANLSVFVMGGAVRGRAPVVESGASAPVAGVADPVPQALVLTAIVIGFAVVAFLAALLHRVQQVVGSGDVDELRKSER